MDTIGYRISKARRHMNINQKELAKRANITEGSLSRYENDIREPKAAALRQLASVLNVSIDYLLGFRDEMEVRPTLSDKTNLEIEEYISKVSEDLISGNVMFDGEPGNKEAIDSMMKAMRMGMLLSLEEQRNKREK
ncbi:HTH-type transcriptional regulator ImmR [bioreactor metagenome]|uniref:HTH-type transcriptional regulator ImmR n=1 Tax=bioreactor metagenome TaxID=1076179 RepID=A0A645FEK4_9ZZZZ|nr:helix-turn-helix transcriptional regulator [Romboutsia lituseburensis]